MEGKPLHLLLAQPHPLLGLLPNQLTLRVPASRLPPRFRGRRTKRLAAALSQCAPGSHADASGSRGWEWASNAAAALVLHLAVCSVLFLFPSRVRAHGLPAPDTATAAAATVEEVAEEGDEEWEAALQKWKGKTYSLSVPLRVVALRGSYPAAWVKVRSSSPPHLTN